MAHELTIDSGFAQQRSAPRFAMPSDIEWYPQTTQPPRPFQGRIRDISVRGFYFFSPLQQPLGTRLHFSVTFEMRGRCRNALCSEGNRRRRSLYRTGRLPPASPVRNCRED